MTIPVDREVSQNDSPFAVHRRTDTEGLSSSCDGWEDAGGEGVGLSGVGAGSGSDLELVEEEPSGSGDGVLGCSLSAPAGAAGAGVGLPAAGYFSMKSLK